MENRRFRTVLENWRFGFEREAKTESVTLPHTWNNIDGQDGGNDYRRTTGWYETSITLETAEDECVFLEILGGAHRNEVFLNGVSLAVHEGGYSTFRVPLTLLPGENRLEISVCNEDIPSIYPQKADFTFYGGLYREVSLIRVPAQHFELVKDGTPGIKVTPEVDLEKKRARVTVESWQNEGTVTFTLEGMTEIVPSENGHALAEFVLDPVHLWDGTKDPFLYEVTASLSSGDEVRTRFGCRVFDYDPEKGFILNGRPYPLRGVCRHQDRKGVGNALTLADHKEDMAIIREIGANTLRLAHYQHAQEFYDLCDENGLVVWAEIPYITMHQSVGRENTLSQMRELIVQNYNHPCIAVWGLSNEITAASPVNEDLMENHRLLQELCHRLDPTRRTTMAHAFMQEIGSPLLEIPDINSYNLYFGWYLGELSQTDEFFDEYHATYPDRIIGFSEYGADANPAYHNDHPDKGDYSEEYQAVYHEHMLSMIEARPYLWATHLWNLFDFAADGRDEGGKHGENQKGLVTFDRQIKKDAFYLYKAAWNKTEPFVHLTGSRYEKRCGETTQVKVYSNQSAVVLYVNGAEFARSEGDRIFTFEVPLTADLTIRAEAASDASICDEIRITKVAEPESSYRMPGTKEIVNWFDQGDIDPAFFSVNDTLGALKADPQAGAVIDAMMARMTADRGDVAAATKDNPALQKMMARMTLLSLLKQGGADEETVKSLNRVLQGFKKPEA